MRNYTTLIIIALSFIAILWKTNARAQMVPAKTWDFVVGFEGGIPTGNARIISDLELGGTAGLQYGVTNNVVLTLTSGYYYMTQVPYYYGYSYKRYKVIPLKVGFKTFFTPHLYFAGEAGAGFEKTHFDSFSGEPDDDEPKRTYLVLSPGLGLAFHSFDMGLRYEYFNDNGFNYGFVALRFAYGFKL